MTDLNIKPYFDDYSEEKKFYQILFRPGYAVQSRELTQLQTIIQNQISRFGNHTFKEGSLVVPGQVGIDTNLNYIKVNPTYSSISVSSFIQSLVGTEITGSISGVKAIVVDVSHADDKDPNTLFVKYTSASSDGLAKEFILGETLTNNASIPVSLDISSKTDSIGFCSRANIQKGVYFINGKFVLVEEQNLILDKYTNKPSYKVGLSVNEKIVSPEEDESLYDNAIGSSNATAPGAHRLYIELLLVKFDLNEKVDTNFLELLRVQDGKLELKVDTSSYSVLADSFARRTYDESGNYTVKDFGISVREYRSNNRGQWSANTRYEIGDIFFWGNVYYQVDYAGTTSLSSPSVSIGSLINGSVVATVVTNPVYNNGVSLTGDKDVLSADIEPGKAYVLGYEIEKNGLTHLEIPKANTFANIREGVTQTHIGSYTKIKNVNGFIDINNFPDVQLYDRFTTTPGSASGTLIGTAKARYMEYDSGVIGDDSCQYIISLFDVNLNTGKKFESDVRQIISNGFSCDISKTNSLLSGSVTTTSASANVVGVATKFTKELTVGDSVLFASTLGIVQSITSDTLLTLTANAGVISSSVPVYRSHQELFESNNTSLIFPMPNENIRKIRDIDDESKSATSYFVKQTYNSIASGTGYAQITTTGSDVFLSGDQPDNYHVVSNTNGEVIPASISLNATSNVATINVGTTYNSHAISVLATVRRTAKEKTKTINRAFSEDIINQSTVTSSMIYLSKIDGIRLIKVVEFLASNGTPIAFGSSIPVNAIEVDITDRYTFDGGQTDAYYGMSSVKNNTLVSPRSPVRIFYDYFDHSSSGDYFSSDSYQKTENVTYVSKKQNKTFNLFDCLDFRPTLSASSFNSSSIPAIGFPVEFDYSFYLPRIDTIAISSEGNFVRVNGTPSVNPTIPKHPDNSMAIYSIRVDPYQVPGNLKYSVVKFDNRRYTMKDIGNIDARLKNVEYYTSLSLLEEQTKNLQLFNSNGDVAFKNGFIVDAFNNAGVSDTESFEYRASVDKVQNICRPDYSIENLQLHEITSTDSQRKSLGYRNSNGIVTLDYSEQILISQNLSSHDEAVVPFMKVSFSGMVNMIPSSDDFYVVEYKEDNVRFVDLIEQTAQTNRNVVSTRRGFNSWQSGWAGIETTANSQIPSTTIVNDRFIDVSDATTIRPRTVVFKASGMKPLSAINAFFDSTKINDYISPATKFELTNKTGEFNTETSSGSESNHEARKYGDASSISYLTSGDIIHNGLSGNLSNATATAVCLLDEDQSIRVTNIIGNFTPGQTIYGTISGSSASLTNIIVDTSLKCNGYGEVAGIFSIPNNSAIRFRTGDRKFSLSDSSTNGTDWTTKSETTYNSVGVVETRQRDIVTTRIVPQSRQEIDPIAQSFRTPIGDGYFVSSVDLFFSVKDKSLPLFFEIREMENGIPTGRIIPGSNVRISPDKISTSQNASVGTNIKMNYPVFLHGDTEYCFVLLSDSLFYRVWCSQLGENDILSGERISKQPHLGTMFKSQNASTWNAEQLIDIKFNMNFCKFVSSGNAQFVNCKLPHVRLNKNAIMTKNGSNKIRITIDSHGFLPGMNVNISGFMFAVNGIPASALNGSHTISSVEVDSFVITVASNASVTGYSKFSENVFVTKNIKFDMIHTSATSLEFPGTDVSFFVKPMNSQYVYEQAPIELEDNVNTEMKYPCYVVSAENEELYNSSNKSLNLTVQLQTKNEYISPVLDTDRFSLNLIGNKIDTNTPNKNIPGLDDVDLSITASFSGNTITASSTNSLLTNILPGQLITITGASNSANNNTFVVLDSNSTTIKVDGTFVSETASINLKFFGRYVSEIGQGSSAAKHVVKVLNLLTPASYMKVFFDVNLKTPSNITTYYKVSKPGQDITKQLWTKIDPVSPISFVNDSSYVGVEYTINPGISFDSAQVKVVFDSSDSSKVPVLKNGIRIIAAT